MPDTPENDPGPENRLEGIGRISKNHLERVKALNESAQANLPEEIRAKTTPGRMFAEGVGKIILGTGFDVAGGVFAALTSFGLSEIFPMEDYAIDFAVAKTVDKITNRDFRKRSKAIGYGLNWIPVVGDFINPTAVDGAIDVFQASKALIQTARGNTPELNSYDEPSNE